MSDLPRLSFERPQTTTWLKILRWYPKNRKFDRRPSSYFDYLEPSMFGTHGLLPCWVNHAFPSAPPTLKRLLEVNLSYDLVCPSVCRAVGHHRSVIIP